MRKITTGLLLFTALSAQPAFTQDANCDWTGTFSGRDGHVRIIQTGQKVVGEYTDGVDRPFLLDAKVNHQCRVNGHTQTVDDQKSHAKFDLIKYTGGAVGDWQTIGDPVSWRLEFEHKSSARPKFNFAKDPAILTQSLVTAAPTQILSTGTASQVLYNGVGNQDKAAIAAEQQAQPPQIEQASSSGISILRKRPGKIPVNPNIMQANPNIGATASVSTQGISDSTTYSIGNTDGEDAVRQASQQAVRRGTQAANKQKIREAALTRQRHQRAERERQAAIDAEARWDNATERTWRVTLEVICVTKTADQNLMTLGFADGEEIKGIGWIKTRIIHKATGQQHDIAPVGGFPRINGDRERAFESDSNFRRIGRGSGQFCRGLGENFGRANYTPKTYDYMIDARQYGYSTISELLGDRRNRIDVMFKLTEADSFSADDELGVRRLETSFAESDFCGACEPYNGDIPKKDSGNGVLTGFRDWGTQARVYYSIQPVRE